MRSQLTLWTERPRVGPADAATHLAYVGVHLAMESHRNGRRLDLHIPPDHPQISACFGMLRHLLQRPLKPLKRIVVDTINGAPATETPYMNALCEAFDAQDEGLELVLYRKIG